MQKNEHARLNKKFACKDFLFYLYGEVTTMSISGLIRKEKLRGSDFANGVLNSYKWDLAE